MANTKLPTIHKEDGLSNLDLKRRKFFIGSSESSSIVGCNPYENMADVYYRKVLDLKKEETTPMKIGKLFQPILLDWVEERLQKKVYNGRRRVHKNGYMQATPNGIIEKDNTVVEVAKINYFKYLQEQEQWGEEGTEQFPYHHYIKLQHQMEVLASSSGLPCKTGYFAVCIGDEDFRLYLVKRDKKVGTKIRKLCENFLENNLIPQVSPEKIPNIETFGMIDKTWKGKEITNLPDSLHVSYDKACEMEKVAKKLKNETKCKILNYGKDDPDIDTFITEDGSKFTYKQVNATRVDMKKFSLESPKEFDVCESYRADTPHRRMNYTKSKKGN